MLVLRPFATLPKRWVYFNKECDCTIACNGFLSHNMPLLSSVLPLPWLGFDITLRLGVSQYTYTNMLTQRMVGGGGLLPSAPCARLVAALPRRPILPHISTYDLCSVAICQLNDRTGVRLSRCRSSQPLHQRLHPPVSGGQGRAPGYCAGPDCGGGGRQRPGRRWRDTYL